MRPPAKLTSPLGLLLVEAILSSIAIAVGLVFISRGLSSQLKALRTVEEYETLLSLAGRKLTEFETQRSLPANLTGTFQDPFEAYGWTATATLRDGPDDPQDQAGNPLIGDLIVAVQRDTPPSSAVRLRAVWPREWLSQ